MSYLRSQTIGSASGGKQFADNLTEVGQLVGVNGTYGDYLNQIQGVWAQPGGGDPVVGPMWGNANGGNPFGFTLAEGEYIVNVYGTSGYYVNQITFVTNLGNAYGPYGNKEGSVPYNITQLDVFGFFGHAGDWINQLGFFIPAPGGLLGGSERPGLDDQVEDDVAMAHEGCTR